MKQIKGKMWVGRIKVLFTRISSYFGYINFLLMLLTFYAVKGYQYASLESYIITTFMILVLLVFVDYFFILPSEQAFLNQQFVRHQNQIYDEIKEIKQSLLVTKKK